MRKNQTELGQDNSGCHGSTVAADVVGNDNGNIHSAVLTSSGGRASRRKMRIVGKWKRQCVSPLSIKEEIKSDVESALEGAAPASAGLSLPKTTFPEMKVEPDIENSQSAFPCRKSADTVLSSPLSTGESVDRVLPGQSGSHGETHIGGGQSVANQHSSSRQSITDTAAPSSVKHFDDCDSDNSGRSSSSSSCRSSSSMSFSSDSSAKIEKTVPLVSTVDRDNSSSDDQATIKREVDCREWNDSKEDDSIVIDYTLTSRYPEKKVFNYQQYERSLLLKAAEKMVNGGQLHEQSTFKVEETNELNTEQQQQHQQLYHEASTSGSSNTISTSKFFVPKTKDDEDRKLFIGGLSFDTSECDLEKYFSRFGVVERVNLKYDPETGISRCFAFISFAEEEAVEEVLRQPMHIVNGRWAEPRRAKSRPVFKKLFVGGLDSSLNTDDIRDYFSRFGKVAQVDIPVDRMSQQRRQFCFVIFQNEEAAEEAATWPRQMVKNRLLDVRRTVPSNVLAQQKRMAQAAGLDLNKYDCNYKLGKMNATARMVTASAAMAAAALATPIAPQFAPNNLPVAATSFQSQAAVAAATAGPSCPQMSVTPSGALVPLADHISQASMAALGVAQQPNAYPAAVAFSSNVYSASNASPLAPTYYPTSTPHSYAFPYLHTASSYAPAAVYQAATPQCLNQQQSYSSPPAYGYPMGAIDYSRYYSQYYSNYISQAQPPPPPPPPPPVETANQTISSSS